MISLFWWHSQSNQSKQKKLQNQRNPDSWNSRKRKRKKYWKKSKSNQTLLWIFKINSVSKNSSDRRFRLAVKISGPALNKRSTGALDGSAVLNRRKRALIRGYLWSDSKLISGSIINKSNSFIYGVALDGI